MRITLSYVLQITETALASKPGYSSSLYFRHTTLLM